jgi:hypothetical protein
MRSHRTPIKFFRNGQYEYKVGEVFTNIDIGISSTGMKYLAVFEDGSLAIVYKWEDQWFESAYNNKDYPRKF